MGYSWERSSFETIWRGISSKRYLSVVKTLTKIVVIVLREYCPSNLFICVDPVGFLLNGRLASTDD